MPKVALDAPHSLDRPSAPRAVSARARHGYLAATKGRKFSSITVHDFRGFKERTLEGLKTINVLAGRSGYGKTTALEAVRLLCSLTSSQGLMSVVKSRACVREEDAVDGKWLLEQLPSLRLSAKFAGQDVALQIGVKRQALNDRAQYLKSACLGAALEGRRFASRLHFFDGRPCLADGEVLALCPAVFATPFSALDSGLVRDCYGKSVKVGSKDVVVEFIREHLDPGLKSIDLDERGRFVVDHAGIKTRPDLTALGGGAQRIFQMGLLFAGAAKGLALIDEFENAIYGTWLKGLAKLVYRLAKQFDAQLFIASHSKECVDAFSDAVPCEDLSFYALVDYDDGMRWQHFEAERMYGLRDGIDFDLRAVS